MKALAGPRPNDGAKVRAAQAFLTRALADGPRPAGNVEREAALIGLSKSALHRARTACSLRSTGVSKQGGDNGAGAWYWSLPAQTLMKHNETLRDPSKV